MGDVIADTVGHGKAAGALLPVDGYIHFVSAINTHPRCLDGRGIFGAADVAQQDPCLRTQRDGQIVQVIDIFNHGVAVEQHLIGPKIG